MTQRMSIGPKGQVVIPKPIRDRLGSGGALRWRAGLYPPLQGGLLRGGNDSDDGGRAVIYCLVPRDLAAKLHEPLRRHFRDDPRVEVIVERRTRERRGTDDRRAAEAPAPRQERRAIHNAAGRRVGDRRASLAAAQPPALPRRAQRHADRLVFVERLEPDGEHAEDLDSARLVTRFQAGDGDAFATLYMRYFDRAYSYLRMVLNDAYEAEDLTQQAFTQLLEALPRYERRSQPFRAWLFVVVRNCAVDHLRKQRGLDVEDASEINRRRDEAAATDPDGLDILGWITDGELTLFVERLPLVQRQVLVLRYMLDLSNAEIAAILGRTQSDVRVLQSRALRFLNARLTAVGRGPKDRDRTPVRRRRRQAPVLRLRRFSLNGW